MTDDAILEGILRILRTDLAVEAPLSGETALIAKGILDSMDFANYLTRVEEVFGITIPNEDIEAHQLGILQNMVAYLASRKNR